MTREIAKNIVVVGALNLLIDIDLTALVYGGRAVTIIALVFLMLIVAFVCIGFAFARL